MEVAEKILDNVTKMEFRLNAKVPRNEGQVDEQSCQLDLFHFAGKQVADES